MDQVDKESSPTRPRALCCIIITPIPTLALEMVPTFLDGMSSSGPMDGLQSKGVRFLASISSIHLFSRLGYAASSLLEHTFGQRIGCWVFVHS